MANRRMFAKTVINSARFLKMPASSRLLYYDLGMNADDEGIVEAFTVMRLTGATEDDLRVLVSKGFVRILNEDLVSLIMDWKTNNLIKTDRFTPSQYHELLVNLGTEMEPKWNPNGTQLEPQVRLGKDRLGEVRLVKNKEYVDEVNEIVLYLNQQTGCHYKTDTKDTVRLIKNKLKQGFTVEDFKTVIDKKCVDWMNTSYQQYLRPITLFGEKFENYLNAPAKASSKPFDFMDMLGNEDAKD